MSDGGKRVRPVWAIALIGGATAAVISIVLDIAGVEQLGRETAAVVRTVAIGAAIGLAIYLGHGRSGD